MKYKAGQRLERTSIEIEALDIEEERGNGRYFVHKVNYNLYDVYSEAQIDAWLADDDAPTLEALKVENSNLKIALKALDDQIGNLEIEIAQLQGRLA